MQQNFSKVLSFSTVPTLHPVLFYDDALGTFHWLKTGTGSDFFAAYATTAPYVGTKCFDIRTKTTTPAADDFVQIERRLWIPATKRARLQAIVKPSTPLDNTEIKIFLAYADGTNVYAAHLFLDCVNGLVKYLNSGNTYATISGWTFRHDGVAFNHVDMAVDFNANTYGRIAVNHQVTDLSAQSFYSAGSVTDPYLSLAIHLTTKTTTQGLLFVDQILLTPEFP